MLVATAVSGCYENNNQESGQTPSPQMVGNPHHGKQLISYFGCGGCHTVPGVPGATGNVGPPLNGFANRVYIAGVLRNTPDNLVLWIRQPQSVVPGNAMPPLGVDAQDARDIAAFLYTQK